jgi:quinoprotein glucose dehydrogenase
LGFARYAPLDQIRPDNVQGLKIVWMRPGIDMKFKEAFPDLAPAQFRATPIIVDGILYSQNALGLVEAFDAVTGQTAWI